MFASQRLCSASQTTGVRAMKIKEGNRTKPESVEIFTGRKLFPDLKRITCFKAKVRYKRYLPEVQPVHLILEDQLHPFYPEVQMEYSELLVGTQQNTHTYR